MSASGLLTNRIWWVMAEKHYRAVWVSDVHLGTLQCKAGALNAFLKSFKCDNLYLVGDIIDGWYIRANGWYWPGSHNNVVRRILKKAEKEDTKVWYVSGNHDEFLRDFLEEHVLALGNIEIVNEHVHTTADGKQLWVVHGDHYDVILKHYKAIEMFGDVSYALITWADRKYDFVRRKLDLPRASLVNFVKKNVRLIEEFTDKFERAVTAEADKRGYDGVICGHIHRAMNRRIEGMEYWNCGDWVDSCTAVVEDLDGKMSIVEWQETDDGEHEVKILFG